MEESATAAPAIRDGTVMVRTLLLGERLDTRGFERGEAPATTPLTIRAGRAGFAVVFRYGAVVSFNLAPEDEAGFLEALRTSIIDPAAVVERDQSRVAVQPEAEEQVDPAGTLIVRNLTVERLQIIADILAKCLVLAHDETLLLSVVAMLAGIHD